MYIVRNPLLLWKCTHSICFDFVAILENVCLVWLRWFGVQHVLKGWHTAISTPRKDLLDIVKISPNNRNKWNNTEEKRHSWLRPA